MIPSLTLQALVAHHFQYYYNSDPGTVVQRTYAWPSLVSLDLCHQCNSLEEPDHKGYSHSKNANIKTLQTFTLNGKVQFN